MRRAPASLLRGEQPVSEFWQKILNFTNILYLIYQSEIETAKGFILETTF